MFYRNRRRKSQKSQAKNAQDPEFLHGRGYDGQTVVEPELDGQGSEAELPTSAAGRPHELLGRDVHELSGRDIHELETKL